MTEKEGSLEVPDSDAMQSGDKLENEAGGALKPNQSYRHLDGVSRDFLQAGSRVVIRGWCFRTDAGGEVMGPSRVRIRTEPPILETELLADSERPDLADAFGDAARHRGFEATFRVPLLNRSLRLHADVQREDGTFSRMGMIEYPIRFAIRERLGMVLGKLARRSAKKARLAVARFKLLVLEALVRMAQRRGMTFSDAFRKTWDAMDPASANQIYHHLRKHGGKFRLGSIRPHEPLTVTYERFPAAASDPAAWPKITVVTPSYNQGQFLEATMKSVLQPTRARVEYIVMDGGSTDGSREIIERHAARLKYWSFGPDGGQAQAVRAGLAEADCGTDDVMAYLNSDDVYCPGTLDFVAGYFADHPEVDVVYGHRILIDEAGAEVGRWYLPAHDPDTLKIVDMIPQETLFWRRRIYDTVDGVDAGFCFALDWDLLLRFEGAGAVFRRLPWFLAGFRIHGSQKTQVDLSTVGEEEIEWLRARENPEISDRKALLERLRSRLEVEASLYEGRFHRGQRD